MARRQPRIKRVYKPPDDEDGVRVLVDRLWPRGLSRERARIDLWLKEIAPSDTLRRLFHGNPACWEEFKAAYYAELREPVAQSAIRSLLERLSRNQLARRVLVPDATGIRARVDQRQQVDGGRRPGRGDLRDLGLGRG